MKISKNLFHYLCFTILFLLVEIAYRFLGRDSREGEFALMVIALLGGALTVWLAGKPPVSLWRLFLLPILGAVLLYESRIGIVYAVNPVFRSESDWAILWGTTLGNIAITFLYGLFFYLILAASLKEKPRLFRLGKRFWLEVAGFLFATVILSVIYQFCMPRAISWGLFGDFGNKIGVRFQPLLEILLDALPLSAVLIVSLGFSRRKGLKEAELPISK